MGRKRSKDFSNSGTNFDTSGPGAKEMDDALFGTSVLQDDPLFSQLPDKPTYRKALEAAGGRIRAGNFTLTMTGLSFDGKNLSFADWQEIGLWLIQLRDSIQWMLGDWVNMAPEDLAQWVPPEEQARLATLDDDTPDGKYKWIGALVDYKYGTLRNFASVAGAFDMSRRRDTLTYSHFVEARKIEDPDLQEQLLDRAETGGPDGSRMSIRDFRDLVAMERGLLVDTTQTLTPIMSKLERGLQNIHEYLSDLDRLEDLTSDQRRSAYDVAKSLVEQMEKLGFDRI